MTTLHISTFADLLSGHDSCTITCIYSRQIVRRLRVLPGGLIELDALAGPKLELPLATPILFEPWVMDRGSILFRHPDFQPFAKLCGQCDIVTYPDGQQVSIEPAPGVEEAPHTVKFQHGLL